MALTLEQEENVLRQVVLPSVRIRAKEAMGSGTIIYSEEQGDDGYVTYVLTNHHVIEKNIEYKDVWDTVIKKNVKKDFTSPVEVDVGRYTDEGYFLASRTCQAEIVDYNKERDLALLKLKDNIKYPTAKLYPHQEAKKVPLFHTLICCGAALGEFPPVVTEGRLNGIQKEIDNYEYWLSSAQSVFGNSGGSIFIARNSDWYFLGVPARISVVMIGFAGSPITHMGYFIPAFSVYEWFDDICFHFLYNPEYTPEQCEKLREEKKEKELALFVRKQN
jgi:S1-C subfamily serine protease